MFFRSLLCAALLLAVPQLNAATAPATSASEAYSLHLVHLHTGERLDVTYRVGDQYVPSALQALNHFLRDHRTGDVHEYDPRVFDVLSDLTRRVGHNEIDIVCGYRTPWSNAFLRGRSASSGVAEHSLHMQAKAIDIRIPGVSAWNLRQAALSLGEGGVGYYSRSNFVHVDVGRVRHWEFPVMTASHPSRLSHDTD